MKAVLRRRLFCYLRGLGRFMVEWVMGAFVIELREYKYGRGCSVLLGWMAIADDSEWGFGNLTWWMMCAR